MKFRFHRAHYDISTELDLAVWRQVVLPVCLLVILILGASFMTNQSSPHSFTSKYDEADVRILQKQIAMLEGESQRLRAFAQKMVALAKLDKALFAFDRPPARGGLSGRNTSDDIQGRSMGRIKSELERLEKKMLEHSHRLERIQLILKARELGDSINFAQWPVAKGYISSHYGVRKDPFNGRRRKHRGIDIAGAKGTAIMSVAAGTVIYSGWKGGYGRVVEIKHDDNVVSRYAHLNAILVTKGQQVVKGALIARLGSSGRSTGPHLHLEILKNNKHLNPAGFFTKK